MKNIFFVIVLLLTVTTVSAQKPQRIAYIDMAYILENVPAYLQAQNTLDAKVQKWKQNLDKQARHIEVLKTDLANEKVILTKDLIEEKEEEISLKQEELRRLESLYFGPRGDLFLIRKQLVQPIQDQVYLAIQKIAARKRFDFVFDKSTDLVMLYSNKKYDISELVLKTINRNSKIKEKNDKKNAPKKELTDNQKKLLAKKITAREHQKRKIEERKKAKLKLREEKRRVLREKKEAQKKKREQKKNKNKNNN